MLVPVAIGTIGIDWEMGVKRVHAALSSAQACPADGKSFCHSMPSCVGINTGEFAYWSLDQPFIDKMKASSVSVTLPDSGTTIISRNPNIPLDHNKYPTVKNASISVVFFSNKIKAWRSLQLIPSGKYVVLWNGNAVNPEVHGRGVSSRKTGQNRLEFYLDSKVKDLARFSYKNPNNSAHITNIRIVPVEYEAAYQNWSWDRYQIRASTNPPIFNPGWIEKYKRACVIRYMNSRHVNDREASKLHRDSTKTRIKPSYGAWYSGFQLERNGIKIDDPSHVWPYELIIEASHETGSTPWIGLRVGTYDEMVRGDTLVADLARLFRDKWGKAVMLEYINEPWNYAYPFNIANNHIRNRGPGSTIQEAYARRTNEIQRVFADAWGNNNCLAIGVAAWQGRQPYVGNQMLQYLDRRYVDVLAPANYVGNDMKVGDRTWNFISDIRNRYKRGEFNKNTAFDRLRDEILEGRSGIITKNWRNDIRPKLGEYFDMAEKAGMCVSTYEGGLHMRMANVNSGNADQMDQVNFFREYVDSHQQAQVESEMFDYMKSRGVTAANLYSGMMNAAWGTFSYWDGFFLDASVEPKRANLIGSSSGGGSSSGSSSSGSSSSGSSSSGSSSSGSSSSGSGSSSGGIGAIGCGEPPYNLSNARFWAWKNCSNGSWNITATAGGDRSNTAYNGSIVSSSALTHVKKFATESNDYASVSGNNRLNFNIAVQGRDADSIAFSTNNNSQVCLTLGSGGGKILVGKNAKEYSGSVNLSTGASCSNDGGGSSSSSGGSSSGGSSGGGGTCGQPDMNPNVDKYLRLWQNCNGSWVIQGSAGGGSTLNSVKGIVTSSDSLGSLAKLGLEAGDHAQQSHRHRIDFSFNDINRSPDGIQFNVKPTRRTCLWLTGSQTTEVIVGKANKRVTAPFDLVTLQRCN